MKFRSFISNIFKKINNKRARKGLKFFLIGATFVVIVFLGVFVAMFFNLTNVEGSIDSKSDLYNSIKNTWSRKQQVAKTPDWAKTDDWTVIESGLTKDKSAIRKASRVTGVPARMIISPIVVEQFRYFGSDREKLKKVFMPLKVLGSGVKFSYGIAEIKISTAKQIEANLKDTKSPYYLGKKYEHLLDFKTKDHDKERMDRITSDDHYYSYLYTALFIKQVEKQWSKDGHSINNRPEIVATLFNLGFKHSEPKKNPEAGGSDITVNGKTYTFGGLAYEFFYSNELTNIFAN